MASSHGKEVNVLFNDSLNTFYGIGHMVKGPFRQRERKPATATWATLSDQQQGFFYMHHLIDRIAHTTTFVTPVVEHWLERESAQQVHHKGSVRRPIIPRANALTTELHLASLLMSLLNIVKVFLGLTQRTLPLRASASLRDTMYGLVNGYSTLIWTTTFGCENYDEK